MATGEKLSSKGQAWFCTTGLPSDIVVEVDDMNFHLHKFPLMSKSRKLHHLITEQEGNHSSAARPQTETPSVPEEAEAQPEDEDQIVEEHCQLTFTDFPGGSETFELAAKFCYGVKVDLSPSNVASLRCAGEFLEMTEEYSEDNLISKTERFLSHSVFNSIKDSIATLKSCEHLMHLAEVLGITNRCIDSIVSRASSADPALFGWPVSEAGVVDDDDATAASMQILWNGIETARRGGGRRRRKGVTRGVATGGGDSWFEELSLLGLPLFKQLILAMRESELNSEMIESCLMHYAKKHIPGVSRSNRKPLQSSSTSSLASEAEQKDLLETVVFNLPLEKSSEPSTATRFLFGLLRTANILNASEACRDALEKKIGSQLEEATLDDLLVPSYSYLNETLYDIDCVERILGHFLDGLEQRNASTIDEIDDGVPTSPALMLVGKLIDGYLSEIASDANLKPAKFYNLAISLPDQARLFDDGLYRAVDVYLKAHPWVSEPEREKICGVLDCQKLTLEACTHAAQNERLPLRAVVQVLFFEQLQLRHAIAGTLMSAEAASEPVRPSLGVEGDEATARNRVGSDTWRVAVRDNQVLRLDMDSMRTRVNQLERECSSMRKVIERMGRPGPEGGGAWWAPSALGKKFGCKFRTQVCDSQERAVVDTRKDRPNNNKLQHHRPRRE